MKKLIIIISHRSKCFNVFSFVNPKDMALKICKQISWNVLLERTVVIQTIVWKTEINEKYP